DGAGEVSTMGAFGGDDRAHERPVVGEGRPVVAEGAEGQVGDVAGEVVIVAGMMVVGVDLAVDGVDQAQVMRLPGEEREVFAEADAWGGGGDGLEWATIFGGGVGLHVPGVDVGRAAAEEEEDGGLRLAALRGGGGELAPEQAEAAGDEEGAAVNREVRHEV